jgi:hypothetical protein
MVGDRCPIIGGWSLFKVGLGYGVSLTLGAQGVLTEHAGLLEAVTIKLSEDWTLPVYDVSSTYKL